MRNDARAAFDAGVAAVQPENLIPARVEHSRDGILISGTPIPRPGGRRVVFAIGKAAPGMAAAWMRSAPDWATEIYVLTPHQVPVPREIADAVTVLRGAHPYPDADGEASTRSLLEVAGGLGDGDYLLVLVSGGGSALMAAAEEGLTLGDVRATTKALLEAGATINEVNTVRRQLLAAAGGGLARTAYPAPVRTLILSDVLGDPLADIASGPTVRPTSSATDALAVFDRYELREVVPSAVTDFLKRQASAPADDHAWADSTITEVIGNNRTAVEAAAAELSSRGYRVAVKTDDLVGEARDRGRELAARALDEDFDQPTAVVFGGETTVTVSGTGRGGRNQELALAAAEEIAGTESVVILAGGTDGIDGLSDNAGALVDHTTVERLLEHGTDVEAVFANNDSASALGAVNDVIQTGPTGTNVCDVTIVLTAPAHS
jgi:hydroxypyruvate reductase